MNTKTSYTTEKAWGDVLDLCIALGMKYNPRMTGKNMVLKFIKEQAGKQDPKAMKARLTAARNGKW